MMKVLLDTNIVIERENPKQPNKEAAKVFSSLDKLGAIKLIHPATIDELNKYNNEIEKNILLAKLHSYEIIKNRPLLPRNFLELLSSFNDNSINDIIDNEILFQIFDGRIDLLITEDKKMLQKAKKLNLQNKVFRIEDFLDFYYKEYPELIEYSVLAVRKCVFADVDLKEDFFDSFRKDYHGFNDWFKKKSNETVYVCKNKNETLGFLYLKQEGEKENYNHISPIFKPAKRLKIGTFKVISSGFRLGERYIKIVFDNAVAMNVDEIYVTLFENRDELVRLKELFSVWGFREHGKNTMTGESVLVKDMRNFDCSKSPKMNFPLINKNATKRFLPIEQSYHTDLFPDAKLRNENLEDFIENKAHRYALQKSYVSWAPINNAKQGDIVLIYRRGNPGNAGYTGVVTTICVIDDIVFPNSYDDFISACQNRSIFTKDQLQSFWHKSKGNIKVIKLLFYKTLNKKVILNHLWNEQIIPWSKGPRTLDYINEEDFNKIMYLSETNL